MVLLSWSAGRYRQGEASFSELAEETGLAVEEIMESLGDQGTDQALNMFLASCRTVADLNDDPDFLRRGQEAVKAISALQTLK